MAVKQLPKISDLPEPPDRLVGDQERFDVLTFNSLKAQKKMVNEDLNKTLIPALNQFAVDVNASVDAAALSERNAHDSEEVAKRKAGEASGSAGAAKVSEDNAKVSETNALASKNAAALSAESAESDRIAAEAARDEAQDLANVGYASESRAGLAKVDGKTTRADAGGVITVKDVAIGGNLEDLASARGQIGPARELGNNVDFNTVTEAGLYLINATGSVNAPRGNQAFFLQVVRSVKGAITKNLFQIAYNYSSVADLVFIRQYRMASSSWSVWTQFITSSQVGDGLTVNNGIISVPEYEGATVSTAGTSGLVPPAAAGQHESFLTGGGEYKPALTKISDSVSLEDSKTAASAKAVKTAYDLANGKQANLGFTPVQQGGGANQRPNKVYLGWDGGAVRMQVDNTDMGQLVTTLAGQQKAPNAAWADGAQFALRLRREGNVDTIWNWAGQGGQPGWLWGGNDGVNMYVYNPSNFSVNYANSAGGARTVSINYAAYNDFPLNANFTMPFDGLAVIFVTGSGWGHIKLFVNGAEVSRARMYGEDSANPCDSPSAFVRSGIVVQGQVNGSRISGVVRCFPGA